MKQIRLFFVALLITTGFHVSAQGLKAFKLPNGLSVFVWEDSSKPDVYGMVSVKAGSKDDPAQYTGLAHYLEHLLFKGTTQIGALDWVKEEPLYQQVVQKYDEMAAETDPVKKQAIVEEINQLSIEISKISYSTEFASISEGVMGGKNLNAGTIFDYTIYHNEFPPEEIHRWLELNSQRLINPIFRGFQAELETVYEEYNMGQDNQSEQIFNFVRENIFKGHPYARDIIGLGEHLKNPRLSKLIEFYNKWYVPGNMALILVGNVNTAEVIPTIKNTFGRLENKEVPVPESYPDQVFKGRTEVSAKISPRPQVILAYPGVTENNPDKITLEICASILTSSSRTGLLDKLSIDGDLTFAHASVEALKEQGRIFIQATPSYDVNQRRFNSSKATEKMLLAEIKKLQEGQFDEQLVQAIKGEMIRNYDRGLESTDEIAKILSSVFVNNIDPGDFLNYKEIVANITMDEVKAIAKKYFGKDYMVLMLKQGKPVKKEKIEKPGLQALQPPHNPKSEYARQFEAMPVKHQPVKFVDMNEVQSRQVNDRSKLFYVKNPENNVFSIIMRYGVGKAKMPKLGLAAPLMNNAGIMGQMEAQEVKKGFSELGATCRYNVSDDYLYVIMEGFEDNLEESCNLMTRQVLLPKLDEKQWDNIKGQVYYGRTIEKDQIDDINEAMSEYLLYGEKSDLIDRLPISDIIDLTIGNLTGEFQRATDYEAEIHYVGNLPFDEVYDILSKNLPLKQGEKESSSPEIKKLVSFKENTVYFVPYNDAKQSTVHFYIEGDNYTKADDVYGWAFNYYFSAGFNSLVWREIREFRSMAYRADGSVITPPKPGYPAYYIGFVGTQADNTIEAIDLYYKLLTDMPEDPERMDNLKNYLRQLVLTSKPDFRYTSQVFESWKLKGYEKSLAEENLDKIEKLTFADLKKYYEDHVKGKKIAISVVGDPRQVNMKALEKYGKVIRLNPAKLFSEK